MIEYAFNEQGDEYGFKYYKNLPDGWSLGKSSPLLIFTDEAKDKIKAIRGSLELRNKEIEKRKSQVGDGSRSDKRRTYRVKDDKVIDHITGKKTSLKNIYKGKIQLLH